MTDLFRFKLSLLSLAFLFLLSACSHETKSTVLDQKVSVKSSVAEAAIGTEALQWNAVSELSKLQAQNPKKVIVDVYTDWCKWCKVMDEKTFSDPALIQYLNENYHMVKLNAETKEALNFNGKQFSYVKNGRRGYNTLAAALLGSRMSYPSFVVLDEDLNKLSIIKGFKNPEAFKAASL